MGSSCATRKREREIGVEESNQSSSLVVIVIIVVHNREFYSRPELGSTLAAELEREMDRAYI